MKKITLILTVVIISLNLSAQSKDSTAPKPISDTVAILSVKDIDNYMQQLSESNVFSPKVFSQFMQVLSQIIATKQKELQSNGKKK